MSPPVPSHRFNIGIAAPADAAGASPPRSAAVDTVRFQSPVTFFSGSNVPGHLNSAELQQRMSAHPGCLTHTLRWRPSTKVVGTVEFQVEFSNHALAKQCQRSLRGRPFLESHPECGDVVLHVKTGLEFRVSTAPVRPLALPAITIATFDIGPRPSADVRSHVFVCVWHCVVDLIVSSAADACESAAVA